MQTKSHSSLPWPLTFGGVAALTHAPRSYLAAYRLAAAVLAAAAIVALFELGWVPVINRTIAALPPRGTIVNGILSWNPPIAVRTEGSGFLAITIDPSDAGTVGDGADFQVRLQKYELLIRSLFGDLVLPYPEAYVIGLNRTEVEPWWGAWHPAVSAGLAAGVLMWLYLSWGILAVIYAWPVRLISFFAGRKLSFAGAWRLSSAALLPGALFFTLAILAYSFHRLNLVQLLGAAALHFVIGWIYVLLSPFFLPRVPQAAVRSGKGNPFGNAKGKKGNPFRDETRR